MESAEYPEPWADAPISVAAEDEFDRSRFAGLVAASIDSTPIGGDSRVFGLLGPWGSGKSSVANMIQEALAESWRVASFTAWAVPEASSLQAEFAATLSSALNSPGREGEVLRDALRKYSAWGLPLLKLIPTAGGVAADLASKAVTAVTEREPWDAQFGRLTRLLADLQTRVLIVCDDIDRLDAGELLEFLKVVRLLGRFPNVHYLVVYDVDTVEQLLQTQGVGSRQSSFMEKIVQHPFELPAIDSATNFTRVASTIEQAAQVHGVRFDEDGLQRAGRLIDVLARGLRTPRQQRRFQEHLRMLAGLVVDEVDLLDFAASEFLRLLHHEVFVLLPRWADDARLGLQGEGSTTGLTVERWHERIERAQRHVDAVLVFEVLAFLFPRLNATGRDERHPRAFADERYLERYFNLGVPKDDVSDLLVARALDSMTGTGPEAHDAEQTLLEIIEGPVAVRARLAVSKALQHRRDHNHPLDADHRRDLVTWLAGLMLQEPPTSLRSAAVVLEDWLTEEVLRAYEARALNRDAIVRLLGDARTLRVLLSAVASLRYRALREEALADFAAYYRDQLESEGPLGDLEAVRIKVSLLARVEGLDRLVGLLDSRAESNPQLFEELTDAFVSVQRWYSGGPEPSSEELSFDKALWETVFSRPLREQLVPLLPEGPPMAEIDNEDVTPENRRRFAVAAARIAMRTSDQPD